MLLREFIVSMTDGDKKNETILNLSLTRVFASRENLYIYSNMY